MKTHDWNIPISELGIVLHWIKTYFLTLLNRKHLCCGENIYLFNSVLIERISYKNKRIQINTKYKTCQLELNRVYKAPRLAGTTSVCSIYFSLYILPVTLYAVNVSDQCAKKIFTLFCAHRTSSTVL
jgi:hypothetical protein